MPLGIETHHEVNFFLTILDTYVQNFLDINLYEENSDKVMYKTLA